MAAAVKDALAHHCDAWAAREWQWGVSDCMLFVADWFRSVTDHDAGARFRGRYDDEASATAVIEEAGGLVQIVADAGSAAGWTQLRGVSHAPRGAIGIVRVRDQGGGSYPVGAISAGNRFVLIYTGGEIVAAPGVLLRGWAP